MDPVCGRRKHLISDRLAMKAELRTVESDPRRESGTQGGASILQKVTWVGMWIFHCGVSITGVGYATAGSVIRDGSGSIVFVNELKDFCYK